MKKLIFIISFFLLCQPILYSQNSLSPEEILNKAISAVSNAKGVEAKFTIYNSGYSGSGSIKTLGNKFNVILPDVEVWFNGKDLFTYNKNSGETTIVIPTDEELLESNPLGYVTSASKKYGVTNSTVKKQGRYVLELLPKDKKNEIKRITLTLRQSDFMAEKIVVEPKNGTPITAEISSFKIGVSPSTSEFEYPRSKYPEVEIIDLR